MNQLPYWLVAVWFGGLIFFAARSLNNSRLVLNNVAPGKNYWGTVNFGDPVLYNRFIISGASVDPAILTDVGRQHLKKAIRNQRIMFGWALCGFILITGLFSYLKAS